MIETTLRRGCMFDLLNKHLESIVNDKERILNSWMGCGVVQERLKLHNFDTLFYRDMFASKVFDYAVGVVSSKNTLGDCPVIGVMLLLFKKKNIPLSDVFIICVHFKNAMLYYALESKILTTEMLKEIASLVDFNFEGVITQYVSLYYNDYSLTSAQQKEIKVTHNPNRSLNQKYEIQCVDLYIKEQRATSAQAYFQEIDMDFEMVEELDELEHDCMNAIEVKESLTEAILMEAAHLFEQYAKVLNMMYEFQELAYSLTVLRELLENYDIDESQKESSYMIKIYLKAIISDLQSWRLAVFITKQAEDIHYLDKSLLSSITQLQMTMMPTTQDTQEEIEFF